MPKVSLLPELNEQLVNGDRAIVVHAGETMQWDPYDYLVKNSGDETVAGVKTFSSSPVVPAADAANEAANYGQVVKNSGDETIAGIKTFSSSPIIPDADSSNEAVNKGQLDTVQNLATPVSDISRLLDVTGDGVPIFPDGAATYFQDAWATTDGWSASTYGTLTTSGGKLINTLNSTVLFLNKSISFSNQLIRIKIKTTSPGTIGLSGTVNGVANTVLLAARSITPGVDEYLDVYALGNTTFIYLTGSMSSGSGTIVSIDTIYIGTGAYTTPIYSKSCCNRLTNNGLLPVQSPFGLALRASGAQYAECDNPVFGTTGTIALYFKRSLLGTNQYILNNSSADTNGATFYFNTSNVLRLIFSNGSSIIATGTRAFADTTTWHSVKVMSDGKVYYDGVLSTDTVSASWVAGLANLRVGTTFVGDFILRIDGRVESAADVASWHNDPRSVDSQQKAVTPTPHALMCRDNEGMTYQAYLTKTGSSTGLIGAMCFDASYLYICTAVNTWKRVALTTF